MDIIMLGVPGAGKGTQAKMLSEKLGIPHISTGDIFRVNIREGTELGKAAADYINKGKLVPDDITFNIVKKRLAEDDCRKGFVLDGFPRTIPQAELLDAELVKYGRKIDVVLNIDVPDAEVTDRISGRLICPKCGANYHKKSNPPAEGNICGKCSGEVIQRKDDSCETVVERIKTYHLQTKPLIGYYTRKGSMVKVDGRGDIGAIHRKIIKALQDRER